MCGNERALLVRGTIAMLVWRNNFNDIFHSRLRSAAYVAPQTKA